MGGLFSFQHKCFHLIHPDQHIASRVKQVNLPHCSFCLPSNNFAPTYHPLILVTPKS